MKCESVGLLEPLLPAGGRAARHALATPAALAFAGNRTALALAVERRRGRLGEPRALAPGERFTFAEARRRGRTGLVSSFVRRWGHSSPRGRAS